MRRPTKEQVDLDLNAASALAAMPPIGVDVSCDDCGNRITSLDVSQVSDDLRSFHARGQRLAAEVRALREELASAGVRSVECACVRNEMFDGSVGLTTERCPVHGPTTWTSDLEKRIAVAALVKAARQLLSGPDGIYLADSIEALEDALKPFEGG